MRSTIASATWPHLLILLVAAVLLLGPSAVNVINSLSRNDPARPASYSEGLFRVSNTDLVRSSADGSGTLAVIATLLEWDGAESSESDVQNLVGAVSAPTTLDEVAARFRLAGFDGKWLEASESSLYRLKKPFVAHLAGRLVIVRDLRQDYLHIADPSQGNLVMTMRRFTDEWSGHVLAFSDPPEAPR